MVIKDLDLQWYWLGYSVGVNSRKSLKSKPDKIVNLGVQGIKTTPTEKQRVSFFIGMIVGRGKIVQNLNTIISEQVQDRNPHKGKGDYLALSIGKVETTRGATVSLPLYISNNSVDNRGYCGYQAKIKYNPYYLTYNGITPTSSWSGSFNSQEKDGIILVQGVSDTVSYADIVLANISFTVKPDAIAKQTIYLQGPSGQGSATDILTRIDGELYYIMPLTLENGEIVIEGEEEPSQDPPNPSNPPIPPLGDSDTVLGPEFDFSYDFDAGVFPVGGASGGATIVITITTGSGERVEIEIPAVEGENHYSGKVPVRLPGFDKGPIHIEVEVRPNEDDELYYWFIKAGALWGFETEIPRDETGEAIPIEEPKLYAFDNFILFDKFAVYIDEVPPIPAPSDVNISDVLSFIDKFNVETWGEIQRQYGDFLTFKDLYLIKEWVEQQKQQTEGFAFSDGFKIEIEEE